MGFDRFRNLGNQVSIALPRDDEGYVGRECPQQTCEGYFKIKPGTGLTGPNLPCHCPYCGHIGSAGDFSTEDQIEYAKSVAVRRVTDAINADLNSLEFEQKPTGLFGIGMSVTVTASAPFPIRHYREKQLETPLTCDACTLQYAVYGVFAFCPDCHAHNSLQILEANINLARKELALAASQADGDLRRYLVEDALENCVSAFDGFARESCRVRAAKSADPPACETLSFQNLPRATKRLQALFACDFQGAVSASAWTAAHTDFMRRHLLAHRAGVVDQQYLNETGDPDAVLGRRITIDASRVGQLADIVLVMGRSLLSILPPVH